MAEQIFTFWEGELPAYIELCMRTWKFSYTVLNYDNLHKYTSFDISSAKRFSLPQIADCVRVHVLRDNGGYWLDADTIMLGDLPSENVIGDIDSRSPTIGFLHTEANSVMYQKWSDYQDNIIAHLDSSTAWNILGNAFVDTYIQLHKDITIADTIPRHPEYILKDVISRKEKYKKFYFEDSYSFADIPETDMIMLHNSWTPAWYKKLNEQEVLDYNCTLSNILRGLV